MHGHEQLSASVYANPVTSLLVSPSNSTEQSDHTELLLGRSKLFVLTDTVTVRSLSKLYEIPVGLSVRHGSNNSVLEFEDYMSNEDLLAFLDLSGVAPNTVLPAQNVLGDLNNNDTVAGGEGQLDVGIYNNMFSGSYINKIILFLSY